MKTFFVLIFSALSLSLSAQNYSIKANIPYAQGQRDQYTKERCVVDVYYPEGVDNFPTIVWFHGGSLKGGEKYIPEVLKNKGVAVVAVNYRLSPKAKHPAYIEDAAAAIAWTFNNIESYGGSKDKIYISGHSAGGYLSLMTAYDKKYLNKHGIDADKIKGVVAIGGHTNTHITIKKERGLSVEIPYIDEFAPIFHSRKDAPATWLITGERGLEMTARFEENAHMSAILRAMDKKDIKLFEIQGFSHGSVRDPGCMLLLNMISKDNSN